MFRQQQTEKHKVVCATMIHTEFEIDTQSKKKISQCIWRLWKTFRNANWYFVKLQNPKQGKKLFQQKLDAINTLKILQFNYTIFLFLIYFFLIFPISKYLCLLAAAFRSFFLRF